MKKIILALVVCLSGIFAANAANVCVKNNTFIAFLKKSVNGTTGSSTNTGKQWTVTFDYGNNVSKTVTGLAACNEISGTTGTAKTNLYTSASDAGTKCWCQIGPAYGAETGLTSYWVFLDTYQDSSTCASSCANDCMTAVKTNTTFRTAIFEAIW